jgi:hypothetical protein
VLKLHAELDTIDRVVVGGTPMLGYCFGGSAGGGGTASAFAIGQAEAVVAYSEPVFAVAVPKELYEVDAVGGGRSA